MGLIEYIKETRGELHHVAWPTRTQTIVYTILVAALSIGIALYLGIFDYAFTTGLTKALVFKQPADSGVQITQQPITQPTPEFDLGTTTQ